MKDVSTILALIDSGAIALPEFQRGFVWNRAQVRALFHSLYRRYPVGGLLVWTTRTEAASHRGDGPVAQGNVDLLLDGQQRMTTLYGVIRGRPPKFFDGDRNAFTGLRFHLEDEIFAFYQPAKMKDDPLWIDVSDLMRKGVGRAQEAVPNLPEPMRYMGRLLKLLDIANVKLHMEYVAGEEKTLDVVVDIFNRVNSGGTKLSKGDLALARICADWPEGRTSMKSELSRWREHGFDFTLDWLLRSVNTMLTGEAKFNYLEGKTAADVQRGLKQATTHIDTSLNMIAGRLGLDHDRVLFGRFAIPVIARLLDRKPDLGARDRDRLLYWFAQAGMWGRFSGSTETAIDRCLAALEGPVGGVDGLLEELWDWSGNRRIEPGDFAGWSLGARFYPILYMLTRMGDARDWGDGLPVKAHALGKMSQIEMHHIFPKAKLYAARRHGHDRDYGRAEVNALANFCFQTKVTNICISDRLPEEYFPKVEAKNPGALASQWIPEDPELWKVKNYLDFLEARRRLLAEEANRRFADLLHEELPSVGDTVSEPTEETMPVIVRPAVPGGIESDAEEAEIRSLNEWVVGWDLPRGSVGFELADETTGEPRAVLDLAWPEGLQSGLSAPVAVLLNEPPEVLSIASASGYRCFTSVTAFQGYVNAEILELETGIGVRSA